MFLMKRTISSFSNSLLKKTISQYRTCVTAPSKRVFIHPKAAVIGRVQLQDNVSIWPGAVLRADVNEIHVGSATNIQDNSVIHSSGDWSGARTGFPCIIGSGVTIGHLAVLHGCTIHDNVLIGISATLLDGVVVFPDTIVGAGALVPPGKHLESGGLYIGNPARRVRHLTRNEIEFIRLNAARYVSLKEKYLHGEFLDLDSAFFLKAA